MSIPKISVPSRPPRYSAASLSTRNQNCGCGVGRHWVQFYEEDEFLIASVGSFVAEGLIKGGNGMIIATPQHLRGIKEQLEANDCSVGELVRQDRLVLLDAADTLQALTADGVPDAKLFSRYIETQVAALTAGGRKVYAFGEMVALLCAEGKTAEALQLEKFWGQVCENDEVTLLCAYPLSAFGTSSAEPSFLEVCGAHSRVLPAESYTGTPPTDDVQARAIAALQQKAAALEAEVARRTQVEETLRRREAELTAFVETASIGLHWVDRSGVILWANQAELDLLGYSSSEYIGRHIAEFHADAPVIEDILLCLCRGEKLRNREARLRCKSGEIKTVMIDSSVLWENGEFVHTQCFTRDVTEQRRAELQSLHLAAIVRSSNDAILSKSLDGIIMSWNHGAERIFGYTPEEVVGKPVTVLIPTERLHEETNILARLRRGERVDHFETIRQRKDGSRVDISLTISPIKDASGKIVGVSKIARDISDKRRVEQALEVVRRELAESHAELERRVEERTAALSEAVAQLEEFSYTVSHDLRTPLRGMQGYSQVLLEDYGPTLDEQGRHCLKRIAENAARLEKMVADVLTYSRVSRAEVKLEPVNLDRLVREIIQQYPAMQPPQARIEVAPLDAIWGHEPSLIQVASNLLSNAVKFVVPGSTPSVRVWTETSGEVVTLWIRDHGVGINPAYQARLFHMFERLHPELNYEGTGVGLAIVRKAVARMGGDVGVESDGRSGTAFWVRLRRADKAESGN